MRITFQIGTGHIRSTAMALLGAVIAVSGGMIAPRSAMAQGTTPASPGAAPKFGHVDIGRILNESKARATAGDDLMRTRDHYYDVLKRLDQSSARFLSQAEATQLAALYEKATPTEDDKKQIGTLEQKGDAQSGQLTRLQNVATPDAAQSAQLAQLSESRDKGTQNLQKIADDYDKKLKDKEQAINQKILADVRASVAKIAQQKGLSVVFTGDIAVYTQNDITDDVIKALNSAK